jgi:hypothetical protein
LKLKKIVGAKCSSIQLKLEDSIKEAIREVREKRGLVSWGWI